MTKRHRTKPSTVERLEAFKAGTWPYQAKPAANRRRRSTVTDAEFEASIARIRAERALDEEAPWDGSTTK